MANFDTATAFLILGVFHVLMPLVTWLILIKVRDAPLAWWCGGGLLIGVSVFTVSIHQKLPVWMDVNALTALLFTGSLMRIQALRVDLGIAWSARSFIGIVVLLSLPYYVLAYGLQDPMLRVMYASIAGLVVCGYTGALALRIGREEQSSNARWIAVYLLVALAFLFRFISLSEVKGTPNLATEGLTGTLIAVAGLFSATIANFAYAGLALDRARRREAALVDVRAADTANRLLSDQIAQLDRQRGLGQLSASLAHELTQPLTAVLTNTQIAQRGLNSGKLDTPAHLELLGKIVTSTQRAAQIIDQIRKYIKPSDARHEPVDLARLVHDVAELLAAESRLARTRFEFSAITSHAWVQGDPLQLSQVLLNGMKNAVEAMTSAPGQPIKVNCQRVGNDVVVQICDAGPGLSPQALAQAGATFFTTKPNGLGLGLSISKAIAQQHGGTLALSNNQPALGATLTLRLPAASGFAATAPAQL